MERTKILFGTDRLDQLQNLSVNNQNVSNTTNLQHNYGPLNNNSNNIKLKRTESTYSKESNNSNNSSVHNSNTQLNTNGNMLPFSKQQEHRLLDLLKSQNGNTNITRTNDILTAFNQSSRQDISNAITYLLQEIEKQHEQQEDQISKLKQHHQHQGILKQVANLAANSSSTINNDENANSSDDARDSVIEPTSNTGIFIFKVKVK